MEMERLEGPEAAEWLDWKHNPQTQTFLQLLREAVQEETEQWLAGKLRSSDPAVQERAQAAAYAKQVIISSIEGIALVQEGEERKDGERNGFDADR